MDDEKIAFYFPKEGRGAWVVTTDRDEKIDTVHATELDALRWVNEQGYGRARFVEYGKTLHDMGY